MTIRLADHPCRCGAASVLFDAGQEPVVAPGGIVVSRGRDVRGWCLACAPFALARMGALGAWAGRGIADPTGAPTP